MFMAKMPYMRGSCCSACVMLLPRNGQDPSRIVGLVLANPWHGGGEAKAGAALLPAALAKGSFWAKTVAGEASLQRVLMGLFAAVRSR